MALPGINRRVLQVGAGLAAGCVLAGAFVLSRVPRAREWIEHGLTFLQANAGSHLIWFCLGQVAVTAIGILPAAIMAVMAGAIYGLAQGVAISAVCTMLGGWLAFLLSRSFLRPWIARLLARHAASERFDASIGQEGWRFVCLMRVSPIMPFAATSYGLGLTRISQRDFLLGTLASLPSLVGYVALGAFGMQSLVLGHRQAGPLEWGLLIAGGLTVAWAMVRVGRLMNRAVAVEAA